MNVNTQTRQPLKDAQSDIQNTEATETKLNPAPTDVERVVSISKQELAGLPVAAFPGKIVMVDRPEKVSEAVSALCTETVIGFDTETKPSFRRGHSNNVALLQLSTHTTCYLFRLNMIGMFPEVRELLENPDILKIGVSIHDDFHNLHKLYDMKPQGFIDLQSYVKDYDILDNSLSRIYAILFGKRISKGQRLTNWEAPELTSHQQEYASLDAYACIQIYDHLNLNGFDPAVSPYYHTLEELHPAPVTQDQHTA